MRDDAILAMQRSNVKRDGVMLAQYQLLKTNQEAWEAVLQTCGWRDRLRWAFYPGDLVATVHAVQLQLIEAAKAEMKEASSKPKLAVPDKSIQVVSR